MEIWKDIKDYERLYQVSNLGRVKSLDRIVTGGDPWGGIRNCHRKGKVLKLNINRYGYLVCGLYKNGKMKLSTIHRLVALAFIDNPEKKPQINHKDGIKNNNKIDNLEWMTSLENNRDAIYKGLINNKGKNNFKARAVIQMDKNGNSIEIFDCIMDATRKLGIYRNGICNVCRGRFKTAGGFKWAYA